MRRNEKLSLGYVLIVFFLLMWGIIIFYPFYNMILVSFMFEGEYMRNSFAFIVHNPTLDAYKHVFKDGAILSSYKSTLIICLVHLPLCMFVNSAMAYALSRKKFFLSATLNNLIVFTMYFSGGIIPIYLLIRSYGLMNSLLSVIIMGIGSPYYFILIKNYFYGIPDDMEESAKVDGVNDLIIYTRIYLPLAKPILATIALFVLVAKWNEWYYPMLFIKDANKWPLQLVLRDMITDVNAAITEGSQISQEEAMNNVFSMNVQMAGVVITMLPIMLLYPFLQKYFMKGIMLGAVKG